MFESFVAFVDVLGFSDMILHTEEEEIEKLFDRILTLLPIMSLANIAELSRGNKKFWKEILTPTGIGLIPNIENVNINMMGISDSFIFWTSTASSKDFIDLTATLRLLFANAFMLGLPLRGGISYGKISFKNLFQQNGISQYRLIGKPIINAVEQEKTFKHSGCVIDKHASDKFIELTEKSKNKSDDIADIDYLIFRRLISFYKMTQHPPEYMINWASALRDSFSEGQFRKKFSMHQKKLDDKVEVIIKNSFDFYLSEGVLINQPLENS